jgi:hypothetical protein
MNRLSVVNTILFLILNLGCKDSLTKRDQKKMDAHEDAIILTLSDTCLTKYNYDISRKWIKNIQRDSTALHIHRKLVCKQTNFLDTADFSNIRFDSALDLSGAHFYFKTCFSNDTFIKQVNFTGVIFDSITNFSSSSFDSIANFSGARFHRTARFDGLTLGNQAKFNFVNAGMPAVLDFSFNTDIPKKIDLTVVNFKSASVYDSIKEGCTQATSILLYKTEVSKFELDYTHFKLEFNGSAINPFKRRAQSDEICSECSKNHRTCNSDVWDTVTSDEKSAIYELLLNNFKSKGQLDSYTLLDEEYHDYIWSSRPIYFCWMKIFPKYWDDYGHKKEWVFTWTGIFFCLFWLINFYNLNYLNGTIYSIRKEFDTIESRRRWYSFIYTGIVFFGLTLKVDKINIKHRGGAVYIIIVYLVGIICLAYMANFVLQK